MRRPARWTRIVALGLALAPAGCATPPPQHPQADDVRGAVEATFAAMRTHDADALRELVMPGAIIVRVHERDGVVVHSIVPDDAFVAGTAGDPSVEIDERLLGTPEVRVDGNLAAVWARYDVRIDGEVHHCGTDAIQLARLAGQWRITAITYTAEPCEAQ